MERRMNRLRAWLATIQKRRVVTGWVAWAVGVPVLIGAHAVGITFQAIWDGSLLRQVVAGTFSRPDPAALWLLHQFTAIALGIACVGTLLGSGPFARAAIVCCWLRMTVHLADAALGVSQGVLLLPIQAVMYGALAVFVGRALKGSRSLDANETGSPTTRSTIP